MKHDYTKNLNLFLLSITILILGFVAFFRIISYNYVAPSSQQLVDNWDVSINGQTYHNVSLAEFEFNNIKTGDTISLSNKIPEKAVGNQTLIFNTYLSSVNVILNDISIYQYAMQRDDAKEIIGSGCHFVIIPRNSSDKTFHINLTARQDNAFTNMETITFVPTNQAYSYYTHKKAPTIFTSFFLVILGIILCIVCAITQLSDPKNFQLAYIGLFSFFMGVWSMCSIKILQIFHINLTSCTNVEYLSLFASAIPLVMLLSKIYKDNGRGSSIRLNIVAATFTIFFISTTILHFTRILHYSQVLSLFHVLVALALLSFLISARRSKRKKGSAEAAMTLGFFILCISFAADLMRFNIQKYLMPNNTRLSDSFIPIGTLLFIVLLLCSFCISAVDTIHAKAEKELLSVIAYHDNLCGIYNRAMCDKEFEHLDKNTENYSIVNLDLNGLKSTNDTLGHSAGDKLLISFSQILTKAFENVGTCYRMGGDEFIVIVPEENTLYIPSCLDRLKLLEVEESKNHDFTIDSSYGIAARAETSEGTAAKVNSLADVRMYEMKTASHNKRQ